MPQINHADNHALEGFIRNAASICEYKIYGFVSAMKGGLVYVGGLSRLITIGNPCFIELPSGENIYSEVVGFDKEQTILLTHKTDQDISSGLKVFIDKQDKIYPSEAWLGHTINAFGEYYKNGKRATLPKGDKGYNLKNSPPISMQRRGFGKRLETYSNLFNTLLPLCQGQRMGIFAGSGVGKSTLLSFITKNIDADIIIVALIGERGREVNEFVHKTFDEKMRKKCIIVAISSDEASLIKRRGAYLAMSIAEYFRDMGKNVVFLFDSLTRLAEAQREIGLMSGEPPAMRAFPPSAFREIMHLCERAGPGIEGSKGDITALFTVLVQGSDMEEPVADAVRGTLDGHIILEREMAEKGLYPAINIYKSISRSLPDCARQEDNDIISQTKNLLSEYSQIEPMVKLGVYKKGNSDMVDKAVQIYPSLENFFYKNNEKVTIQQSFEALKKIVSP